ncbi:CDP-glycerol glycerophosphotransferase family protein [Carnobacterium mobile]|uniref:CDP-glycerol glycerophosphotransferase family protein n=1 Tax=Carnobacterium mobile TaxID=2750 RepID=UPI001869557A|nr:CDP-glycerol glycerophosphotransferase family protein [Carnobacterium mobile]
MNNIHIETTQSGFVLSDLPYAKLKLQYKKSEFFIEKEQAAFTISKELLYSIAHQGEALIKIFGQLTKPESYSEITLDSFSLQADSPLFFEYKQNIYYLYVSQHNTLRIISNQRPSVLSYYKKHQVTIVEENTKELTFQLNIISHHFKLTGCSILIKDRSKQLKTAFEAHLVAPQQSELNEYTTTFNFSINKNNLKELYPSGFNLSNYDTNIFDLFFSLTIQEQPLTDYAIRMQYFDSFVADEHWIDLNEKNKLLIRTYPTETYHNLSFRISTVPKETYLYYQAFKSDPLSFSKQQNKRILLVAEYPHKAQDTGFSFFEYVYKKYKKECAVYYVISKDSKDLNNLKKYKNNIVYYKSKEHLKLFLEADVLAHSHNSFYGFPFVTDFIIERSNSIFKVFLQHGLQSIRDVSYLYGKKPGIPFTNLFIVSSNREKEIVINNYNYDPNEVAITGLSRFDTLLSKKGLIPYLLAKKKLLIMPSWRKGQDHLSDEEFVTTLFYKTFQSLLHNDKLKEYALKYNMEVLFYLHTNFQKYSHLFTSNFITIVDEGTITVQQLLKMSSILITDFSSVALDYALLKRPILYYQFDGPPLEARTNDFNTFFPGDIISTEEELLTELTTLKPTSKMKSPYQELVPDLYQYNDTNARQRIYNEIIARITD